MFILNSTRLKLLFQFKVSFLNRCKVIELKKYIKNLGVCIIRFLLSSDELLRFNRKTAINCQKTGIVHIPIDY